MFIFHSFDLFFILGKPAIVTPFYGDQYLNAAALGKRGMGFRLNILEITADKIYELVDKALHPQCVIWSFEFFYIFMSH